MEQHFLTISYIFASYSSWILKRNVLNHWWNLKVIYSVQPLVKGNNALHLYNIKWLNTTITNLLFPFPAIFARFVYFTKSDQWAY